MTDGPRPPAHVSPYVEVLGQDQTVEFLLRFGGAELYLSPTPKGRSEVENMLGAEAVAKLAALDLPRRVPTAKKWVAQVLKSRGLSHAEIARILHTTDVTVRGYLAITPASDPRQRSLL